MTAIPKISALFEDTLAASLSASGTSFTLVSGLDHDGNALSGLYSFIIDEGSDSEEFVTGMVLGTTVTITARGCDADDPITEVSAKKVAHGRNASVKITTYPILGFLRNLLNAESGYTLPNPLRYASGVTPSDNSDLADKEYVDGVAVAGASNANDTTKGIVERATQAEIEAGTATGGTGAALFIAADRLGAKLYYGYAADAGATDTYAITCSPVPTAYTTGMVIQFKANTVNTGVCTLNVNSLGAKSLKVNKDLDPQDGYIKAGQIVTVAYDGTNFQILSVAGKPSVSQSGEEIYAASSTGNDTYVITVAPVPSAYVTGQVFRFKAGTANTGAATLNVNSLGAKSILRPDSSALADGDIAANQLVEVIYDGTNFLMLSPVANAPKYNNGVTTRAGDTAGSQTIAHTLGRTPRRVRLTGAKTVSGSVVAFSWGVYNGTTTSCVYGFNAATAGSANDSTNVIHMNDGSSNELAATVSVDATNITLTWTKTGTPSANNINIMWEAEA